MYTIKSKKLNMTADRMHTRMVLDGLGYKTEAIKRIIDSVIDGKNHKLNLLDGGTISYSEV